MERRVPNPVPKETKFFIKSLVYSRVSEEERLKLGSDIRGSRRLGPFIIEKVEEIGGNTRVTFLIKDKLETDILSYDAEYAGYQLFDGSYPEKDVEAEEFRSLMTNFLLPYISEVIAYLTGRSGISPLILPPILGGIKPTQKYSYSRKRRAK